MHPKKWFYLKLHSSLNAFVHSLVSAKLYQQVPLINLYFLYHAMFKAFIIQVS